MVGGGQGGVKGEIVIRREECKNRRYACGELQQGTEIDSLKEGRFDDAAGPEPPIREHDDKERNAEDDGATSKHGRAEKRSSEERPPRNNGLVDREEEKENGNGMTKVPDCSVHRCPPVDRAEDEEQGYPHLAA